MAQFRVTPPVLLDEGRTNDGRYAIDVAEYAALVGISLPTAWRRVRSGHVRSIQPTGKNGRVHIPVQAVLAELGIAIASDLEAS